MVFFKDYEVKYSRPNTPYGFKPRRLIVEGKLNLSVFSFNVMFMSYGERDGKAVTGTALYYPDLSSMTEFNNGKSIGKSIGIKYHNQYCLKRDRAGQRHCYLIILYYRKRKQYYGTKFLWGVQTCDVLGNDWDDFFANLTAHGLYNSECCMFEDIDDEQSGTGKNNATD